jgi:undecaprenyl-diphosphatase
MPLLQVIVLALVQGLTEFLPISSTAHLYLTSWLLGWNLEGLDFDIALHLGTLLAVLLYFAGDWVQIVAQAFGIRMSRDEELKHNHMLLWLLAIGSIPIGIAGVVFKKQAENAWRNPFVIGGMLIAVGVLMYLAENAGKQERDLSSINLPDALTIGAAQALAVVPGTSRSGVTIAAGLLRNLDRATAARFSFLLSTPAIAAAAAKDFYDLMKHAGGIPHDMRMPFLVGIAVSGITGCLVIQLFMRYLRHGTLTFFVAYRVIFGIMIIALAHFFRLTGE